jgi:GT2 family glycosyltransferase
MKSLDVELLDINFYRNSYNDLKSLSDKEIVTHWKKFGDKENRYPNFEVFNQAWRNADLDLEFNVAEYLFLNPDLPFELEFEAKIHFLNVGRNEFREKKIEKSTMNNAISTYLATTQSQTVSAEDINNILSKLSETKSRNLTQYVQKWDSRGPAARSLAVNFYQSFFNRIPTTLELELTLILSKRLEKKLTTSIDPILLGVIHMQLLREYREEQKRVSPIQINSLHLMGESKPRDLNKFKSMFARTPHFFYKLGNWLEEFVTNFKIIFNSVSMRLIPGKEKVSLIASIYDGDRYIHNFLRNITSLSLFRNCELIFIDADSPGSEEKTIRKYQALFSNITYLKSDNRIGIYEAWNMGIKLSTAENISNVNLDDLRLKDYLKVMLKVLNKNKELDVVYGNFYYALQPNFPIWLTRRFGLKSHLPILSTHNLLEFNSPHCAPMWRRNLHDEIGYFDTEYLSAGDWEFWLRCADNGKKFGQVKSSHAVYYINPEGLSTSLDSYDHVEQRLIRLKYKHLLISENTVISNFY